MESSSEDSFVWAHTSEDSSDSDSMAPDDNVICKSENKHGKKRKAKEISDSSYNETEEDHDTKINIKVEREQGENESFKRKKVKLEPESDCDVPKKKKKHKHIEVNGNQNDSQDSYDESHLEFKVKQEQIAAPPKKKRKQSIIEPDDTENLEELKSRDEGSEICDETVKHKKKKKKSKKRNDNEGQDAMDIDYKEDITETTVNKSSSSSKANRSTENSYMGSNTFQDESGYEEISAIQSDGDNISHTISFNDSKVIKDKKKNDTLLKSTIVNQFKLANNNGDLESSQDSGKRIPRISDRIRFEDDDDDDPTTEYSDIQESTQDKESTKLKKFIKTKNNIKLVSQQLEHNSILTQDDEVWIVKCPKEIDIQAFCNTDLNLNGKCKIKIGGQTYEGNLEEGQTDTTAALSMQHGKYEVQNLPLCGIINFRKRIPKAHFREDNIMVNNQTNFIPLPDTKCRHPLFGSNYKKAIKIPSAVAERLNAENDVTESVTITKKKKKKHKKDRSSIDHEEPDVNSTSVAKSEPDITPEVTEKKKNKRKYVEDVDVVDGPAPKKAKRIKHDPESAEAWESEKAIEENLFNF